MNTLDPGQAAPDSLKVYTADEAAAVLKCSADWLKRRAAARKIPFTMLGGSYRFSSAHLDEIIRLNEQLPADQPRRVRVPRAERGGRRQAGAAVVAQLRPRPDSARRKNKSAA